MTPHWTDKINAKCLEAGAIGIFRVCGHNSGFGAMNLDCIECGEILTIGFILGKMMDRLTSIENKIDSTTKDNLRNQLMREMKKFDRKKLFESIKEI